MTKEEPDRGPAAIMFSAGVRAEQTRLGSRRMFERRERDDGFQRDITPDLAAFLAARDSAYLATASAEGQPYVQHRGGPKGFLKVLGPRLIGFADFGGNRQYVTLGHLKENPKAFLFLMDYANQTRVKLWGRIRVDEEDADLIRSLAMEGYPAPIERALLFELEVWDVNCKQHILPRYDEEVLRQVVAKLTARITDLEEELARLKAG